MSQQNAPTPKAAASQTAASAAAKDATKGEDKPVAATQDPNLPAGPPQCDEETKSEKELICEQFDAAADKIASATEKLTKAGMSGTEAGKLALELFKAIFCCD